MYLTVVDALGPHWWSTSPSSRAALSRRHIVVNRAICIVLHEAGYSSTLEPVENQIYTRVGHDSERIN